MTILTPSVSRLIEPSQVPGLQVLVFGGETLLQSDVDRWHCVPELRNGYGPAEASCHSTIRKIETGNTDIGIGDAFGAVAWIVEPKKGQELVPIGSPGELWLEGPIVGLGYLNDPQRTAASFVSDPPWLRSGSKGIPGRKGRLYRTGQLPQDCSPINQFDRQNLKDRVGL